MSMFISKALRRAEVFLEQVDESVAQASRRLVVEGATGAVDDNETYLSSDDENTSVRRASSIPTAEFRTRPADAPEEDQPAPDVIANVDFDADGDHENIFRFVSSDSHVPERPQQLHSASQPHIAPVLTHDFDPNASNNTVVKVQSSTSIKQDNAIDDSAVSATINIQPSSQQPQLVSLASSHSSQLSDSAPAEIPCEHAAIPPAVPTAPSLQDDDYVVALRAENSELRKELETVDTDFEQSRRDRSKLVKNIKRMKDVVSEMDETLRDKSTEARQLQQQLLQTKEQLESLRSHIQKTQSRGKDELDTVRNDLAAEIKTLTDERDGTVRELNTLREENERLNEALLHGHEVDLATADGARQDASQAHRAYEAEANAHRETRQVSREREESLQEEAALATRALAAAQRKAEECTVVASASKASLRTSESKLATISQACDTAFARIQDLEEALRLFEHEEGEEAPGQREAKAMQDTVSELENALEAKNVEIGRLEGELEAVRASLKSRRDGTSPRTPGGPRAEIGSQQEVEIKIRHMADASLRKQAQLEVLRSENRALQHQLTSERKRTREAQAMAAAASSSSPSIRGGFRSILLESGGAEDDQNERYGVRDGPLARFRTPRDWPRPIAKVIGTLDRLSAQALGFLRKEPLLRIVLLVYLAGMHLFVYSLLHWHVDAVSGEAHMARLTGGRIGGGKVTMYGAAK